MGKRLFPLFLFSCLWIPVRVGAGLPAAAGGALPMQGPLPPRSSEPLLAPDIPGALSRLGTETQALARLSSRFLMHYQAFIQGLSQLPPRGAAPRTQGEGCLPTAVREPYLLAIEAWDAYHLQARVVLDAAREPLAYFNAGYGAGLTPDVAARLTRAAATYEGIKKQHQDLRELVVSQLEPEVRHLGCDPATLVATDAQGGEPTTAAQEPSPGGAADIDDEAGAVIALPSSSSDPLAPVIVPGATLPPPDPALSIRFTVDNSHCQRELVLFVDGYNMGSIPGGESVDFIVEEGRHAVCLTPRGSEAACVDTGDALSVQLYDGWIIRPGC